EEPLFSDLDDQKRLETFIRLTRLGVFDRNSLTINNFSLMINGQAAFDRMSNNRDQLSALEQLAQANAFSPDNLCQFVSLGSFKNRSSIHSVGSNLNGVKAYVAYLQQNPFCKKAD
ncbi:MAG: hypothetical protein NTX25_01950, partial [Proteobacteria bacterium]|nr:hypothetical protein [Pseudomonadota bacterium]